MDRDRIALSIALLGALLQGKSARGDRFLAVLSALGEDLDIISDLDARLDSAAVAGSGLSLMPEDVENVKRVFDDLETLAVKLRLRRS